MRDCRLGCVQAVIERQKRMPAEANDDRLFLDRQHRRSRLLWSRPSVHDRAARLPLAHRLLIDAVTSGERSQALFTMLYRSTDRLSRRGAPVKNLAHSASFDSCHKNAPSKPGTKHISVVALVGVQDVAARKPFEQRLSSGAVCYLSASEHEGKRATLSVCQRVDFRCAAAARTADGLVFPPPFPPAAERCVLTAELSIKTCAGGPPA